MFDSWLEICFLFFVSSVQVAHLACVLIGSLAKLSSSLQMECASALQMNDIIIGKVI
jgi:hypothetical protein